MGKRIITALLILGGAIASGCSSSAGPSFGGARGAILPHHLLVEEWIENFYTTLENPAIKQIILLSPNHFNYGYNAIRTTDEVFATGEVAAAETKDFELEHGVTVHEPFIEKHFPQAIVTPIIIKIGTNQARLNQLIEQISALDSGHTLVLASIDFTHMDPEEIALQNDQRTIEWLSQFSDPTLMEIRELAQTTNPEPAWDSVAMDSPEALYVLTRVMENWGSSLFKLWERTASVSLIPGLDSSQNTSHIFGAFK